MCFQVLISSHLSCLHFNRRTQYFSSFLCFVAFWVLCGLWIVGCGLPAITQSIGDQHCDHDRDQCQCQVPAHLPPYLCLHPLALHIAVSRVKLCMFNFNQGIQFRPTQYSPRMMQPCRILRCRSRLKVLRDVALLVRIIHSRNKLSHGGITAQMGFYCDPKWATNWRTLLSTTNGVSIVFTLNTICPFSEPL